MPIHDCINSQRITSRWQRIVLRANKLFGSFSWPAETIKANVEQEMLGVICVSLYSVTLKICSCSFSFSDKNLKKKNQSNDAQTQTDWQICMHTLGVKIHQINVPGLMSKIQLHRFKLLESGQSWEGIKAESMLAFLYQKSLIWQPCHFFLRQLKSFTLCDPFCCTCQFCQLSESSSFLSTAPCYIDKERRATKCYATLQPNYYYFFVGGFRPT